MMLYGNIIFIKKTGGDGSKYPVTDKSIKIGRSEECLIRIYNNKVASEHCQLIIGDDGQAKLKDLSNQTVLNGNISVNGEVTLCHGDIFKVGERLARWEYFPTSKYYKQALPTDQPTVRLVAVVMPQQRSVDDQLTPGTSAAVLKNTPIGGKRRYSERFSSDNTSSVKIRKSTNSRKSKDFSKFLMGCHGLKTTKLLMSGSKIKGRKSTSGIINSKTPKGKSRKSTLPSWKVNIVTPPSTSSENSGSSLTRSQRKSSKSPQDVDLLKNTKPRENVLPDAKRNVKPSTPEELVLSESTNVLKSINESAVKSEGPVSFSKYSSPRKPAVVSTPSPKAARRVYSERKRKPSIAKSKEIKKLSSVCNKEDNHNRSLNKELHKIKSSELTNTPETLETTSQKYSVKKVVSTGNKLKTPRLSTTKSGFDDEKLNTLKAVDTKAQNSLVGVDVLANSKQQRQTSVKNKLISVLNTPVIKIPQKLEKSVGKLESGRKILNKRFSSASPSSSGTLNSSSSSVRNSSCARSLTPSRTSAKKINLLKERTSSPRGIRRELSPSISSAERAAKKLKTSCPKKPDKNKKAALLLLGKANFKQLSQNAKVLLKQRLVKRAIKQSTTANVQKNDQNKKVLVPAVKGKPKKTLKKDTSKPKIKVEKKCVSNRVNSPAKSAEVSLQDKKKTEKTENTPKSESVEEENLLGEALVNEGQSPSKFKENVSEKSIPNQYKTMESPQTILSKTPDEEKILHYGSYENAAENFLFHSNRRCSKRLSSKNDTGRPDFIELSPTALGLIPKNLEVFKTPKQNKRRSSSLVTPKMGQSVGIIKSASTSKIGNRKSVRFLSKDLSINSDLFNSNLNDKSDFEFGIYQTPDVSVNAFVSPLGDKSNASNKSSREIFSPENNAGLGSAQVYKSNSEPRKCVRKLLQSPQPKRESLRGSRSSATISQNSDKDQPQSGPATNDSRENAGDVDFNLHKLSTLKTQKNSKNSLSCSKGLQSSKGTKGPKNELVDIRGVKELLTTPKAQKSPKNDLSDLRGVKKLLGTPRVQKSPKNDLSDLRGVKKLLRTPKVQKSPKNDLSDLRGVKKLLGTPRVQKSPKNELSDLRGVKKLLATPKVQKSPKNELSDLRGVKKLLGTPRVQKSPKNELSDLRGVKKLLGTPRVQKSPKNELSDLRGVKKLLGTPKVQKSPKNDLSDLKGVKKLLTTPQVQKSPKNSLTDFTGVKELLQTPKSELLDLNEMEQLIESPVLRKNLKNDLNNPSVAEMESLVDFLKENFIGSSKISKLSRSCAEDLKELPKSPESRKDAPGNLLNDTEMKQLLDEKSPGSVPKGKKMASRNSHVNNFKAIRGRRTIYSNEKSPRNDLSDVAGVRELFSRHKPISDYNVNLTGVAELFNLPEAEAVTSPRAKRAAKNSVSEKVQKVRRTLRSVKTKKDAVGTRSRLKKDSATKRTIKKPSVAKKSKVEERVKKEVKSLGRKPTKRKAAEKAQSVRPVKSPSSGVTKGSEKSEKAPQRRGKTAPNKNVEVKTTRKRKAAAEDIVPSPPKLRRKQITDMKSTSSVTKAVTKTTSRSKTAESIGKTSGKRCKKASDEVKDNGSKAPSKVQSKKHKTTSEQTPKVQTKRSQRSSRKNLSGSQDKITPVKTRSIKGKSVTRKRLKTQSSTVERRSVPSVRKSTRRK